MQTKKFGGAVSVEIRRVGQEVQRDGRLTALVLKTHHGCAWIDRTGNLQHGSIAIGQDARSCSADQNLSWQELPTAGEPKSEHAVLSTVSRARYGVLVEEKIICFPEV